MDENKNQSLDTNEMADGEHSTAATANGLTANAGAADSGSDPADDAAAAGEAAAAGPDVAAAAGEAAAAGPDVAAADGVAAELEAGQMAVIHFPDLDVPVHRGLTPETYLVLQPPEGLPYVVVPQGMAIEQAVAFVQQRLGVLLELQTDMIKHFRKTKSLKCRFRTGDVAYLLGRPFMLRSNPLSSAKKAKKGTRSRANVQATMRSEFSVIDLHVPQSGSYDQGRIAFMSFAGNVFSRNIQGLIEQCMARVFPEITPPNHVKCRPMHDDWVRFDQERNMVWFSEKLIPYPVNAIVYAYLVEAIKRFAPAVDGQKRQELLEAGVPDWQEMRTLLADPHNRYAL
ncbi:MAG: DUF45 domain-containing protein [Actinomycetia bacterium]|nr:DUF45 domain-containing protein [Actinomycetes bacterium]